MRLLTILLAMMPLTLTAQVLPADWSTPNTAELPAPFNACGYEFSGLPCEASNCQ